MLRGRRTEIRIFREAEGRIPHWSALLLISLSFLLGGCAFSLHSPAPSDSGYGTPVFSHDFPDPFILRVGDVYYAYATNAGARHIQVLRSRDRANWERVGLNGDALLNLPRWAMKRGGLTWAPGVLQRGHEFILYYATHSLSHRLQCISYATSDWPEGPFVDDSPEPFICNLNEGDSVDPEPFVDPQGTTYLLWKSDGVCAEECSWINIQQLTPDGKGLVGKARPLITRDQEWEGPLVENPSMVFHEGRYYLIYSANRWKTAQYAVGYAICDTPVGPCNKPADKPLLRTMGNTMGPGGASFFTDHDGDVWIAYHAWRKPNVGYSAGGQRSPHLRRVTFINRKPVIHHPQDQPQ
jgi:beta-xylosidase